MGFLDDFRYFAPALGPIDGFRILVAKISKSHRKRRVAAALRAGEPEDRLFSRLGLDPGAAARGREIPGLWAPLRTLGAGDDPAADRERADRILAGRQVLFGAECEVGWPPRWDWRWHGTENEALFRDDVRSTWEVQRLQGLLPLARSGREGDAAAYLEAVAGFGRAHPGPRGTAWESALEPGLRLIALAQGLPLVAGSAAWAAHGPEVLRMLDRHARFLAADLSLDKVVRGNHLLGELAGLLVAGHLLPGARAAWWGRRDPRRLLETEILAQFHPDGVSVEQSLPYEKFILEFLWVAAAAAARRGEPLAAAAMDRLAAAGAHLEAVSAPGGTLPRVGDGDSGRGADWGDGDPLRAGALISRWSTLVPLATRPRAGAPALEVFPHGGHVVLRHDAAGDFLFVRGGPFGWGPRGPASHSHCDWGSPVIHVGGEAVLDDPGVFGYGVAKELRDAFRGWRAHSVVAGEASGPVPAGRFRWGRLPPGPAAVRAALEPPGGVVEIRVTPGPREAGGPTPLTWWRRLVYNELERSWTIEDDLRAGLPQPVFRGFCFAPGVVVEAATEAGVFAIGLPSGRRLRFRVEPAAGLEVAESWSAPAYGKRIRSLTVVSRLAEPEPRLRAVLEPA